MRNRCSALSFKTKMIGVIVAILFAVAGYSALSLTAYAAAGDEPAHSKTITDNEDGTYKIELTVTGDADAKTYSDTHVNVLIVYDESSSMTSYNAPGSSTSRADHAEATMYDFVSDLNEFKTEKKVDIQAACIGFGPDAYQRSGWTSDLEDVMDLFDSNATDGVTKSVHQYGQHNATDWAAALTSADSLVDGLGDRSEYPTFVILVTDGGPTDGGGGGVTVPGPTTPWYDYERHYAAATTSAKNLQDDPNVTLYGIYAFGSDANLLDDLMYYANTGEHRTVDGHVITNTTDREYDFGNDDGADYYYNADSVDALTQAINDIFNEIIEAIGITDASMSDGTTNQVTVSSGDTTTNVELLGIDEESYQYWLSFPVDSNNKFTAIYDGQLVEYTVSSDGKTITWGDGNSLSVENGEFITDDDGNKQFKFEWTKALTGLYDYAPPEAELKNGAVEWNLEDLDVLLSGVTYSVTFDVYPSQTALDYKARIENGESYESVVPEEIREAGYFKEDGSLETNTTGTLTYSDTRLDNPGPKTATYDNPPAVKTEASEMEVEKEWEGADAPELADGLDVEILADDEDFYTANLKASADWKAKFNISYGIMKDGVVMEDAPGHDFSFAELGSEQWRWELEAPTVHPMIIDGEKTMLVKVDKDHPLDGRTPIEINGAQYYEDEEVASLKAVNHRRSNLNLTKKVEGNAPASATFPFDLVVNNSKVENGSADDTDSDYYVWFSIRDADGNVVTTDAGVSGATQSGNYFYAPSGDTISLNMKEGWNLRFTNLPTGTTYTFTEGNTDEFEFVSSALTKGDDDDFSDGQSCSGTIVKYNAESYEVTYTNKYTPETTEVYVEKVWYSDDRDIRPESIEVQLYAGDDKCGDPVTLTATDDWSYTWTDLLLKDEDGEEIEYSVKEVEVPKGYHESYESVEGGAEWYIYNEYEAEGEITLTAQKKLENGTLEDGQFEFELLDEDGEVIQTTTNDADGNVIFDPLKFDLEIFYKDLVQEEANPLIRTAIADEADAIEEAAGAAVSDIEAPAAEAEATDEAAADEAATDEGEEAVAEEAADEAEATDEEAIEEAVDETASTVMAAEGDEVTAFADGRSKTFTYTIREVAGDDEDITYDDHEITVTVTVTDNGDGTLDVSAEYDGDKTFVNTLAKPEPVKVALEGIKTLEGRDLVDGEFSFELRDADGEVVTTATNDADGNIDFGTYTFEEEGTYTYTATEVQGSDEEITYDTSEQTFTIEVVENDQGGFDATVTCGDTYQAQFTNKYQKKEDTPEEPEIPKTGDSNPFGTFLVLAGAAALAVVSKKRLSLIGRD